MDFSYSASVSEQKNGVLETVELTSLKYVVVLAFSIFISTEAEPSHHEPFAAHASTYLSQSVSSPLSHRRHGKHLSPPDEPSKMRTSPLPLHYGSFPTFNGNSSNLPTSTKHSTSRNININLAANCSAPPYLHPKSNDNTSFLAQPPSLNVSGSCKPGLVRRCHRHCQCVYPIKIVLLLLNISLSSTSPLQYSRYSNQSEFLRELAYQLGLQVRQIEMIEFSQTRLSEMNITMNIVPLKGISFSAGDAHVMSSLLAMHKVHLDPTLVADYKLLSFTWFRPPASSPGTATPHPPPVHAPDDKRKISSPTLLIIGICSGTLAMFFISLLILRKCQSDPGQKKEITAETTSQRTEDAASPIGSLPHPFISSTWLLTYQELKVATKDFEPASVIGQGGSGKVFKGVLSDGTPVAIKKLTRGRLHGEKEFLVEVEMLSRLFHRNLVKLLGYCSSHDSPEKLLCYELVPNGSLEAWLHGSLGANSPLEWDTRMKIALDAARGLAYLHEDSHPPVIHRDFKASNILVDNDFHAKVADFGLAKQAPQERGKHLSTTVMGTFGYLAPEYAMTGRLLVKSDVYSYGVVLLELLTGRMPVDMSQPLGKENLASWARPILRHKDRLVELADPKLEGKYPKDDFIHVCSIAAACVALEPKQRPMMGEVVQSLKMVQRRMEYYQDFIVTNIRHYPSTKHEFDGASSSTNVSSNVSEGVVVFSEDPEEGK